MLFALFLLICVAGTVAITILFRDSYIFGKVSEYITILQTEGEDSPNEYAFREKVSETVSDLCHLIRTSRDDAKWKGFDKANNQHFEDMLVKVVKSKRKSKSPRGKK